MKYLAQVVALVVKDLPANAGDIRDMSLIPGFGRFPGGGHGNPFPYSCLGEPIDREAWWATVHVVTKDSDMLKQLSMYTLMSWRSLSFILCTLVVTLLSASRGCHVALPS